MKRTIISGLLIALAIILWNCSNDPGVTSPKGTNNPQALQGDEYPGDRLYTTTHEWIKVGEDSIAVVGITSYGLISLGTCTSGMIVENIDERIKKPLPGAKLTGSLTTKTMYVPVDGNLHSYNPLLDTNPSVVNSYPYTTGWVFKLYNIDYSQLGSLMTASEYIQYIGQ